MRQVDIEAAIHSALSASLPIGTGEVAIRAENRGVGLEVEVFVACAQRPSSTLVLRLERDAQDTLLADDQKTRDALFEQLERCVATDAGKWYRDHRRDAEPHRLIVVPRSDVI